MPEHRAIYVAIHKVASSSLLAFIARLLQIEVPEGRGPHSVFWDHPMIARDDLPGYAGHWRFCIVRNPWDRLVSCYHSKIKRAPNEGGERFVDGVHHGFARFKAFRAGMTFEAFAHAVADIDDDDADPHFLSQHRFVSDADGRSLVDYTGRFERLPHAFRHICERLDVDDATLPHHKQTRRREHRSYYGRDLRERIARRYAEDIDRFDYAF